MFMTTISHFNPFRYYWALKPINRIHFWTLTSSCFVAVFTCWLGFVYQYFVVDKSKEESKLLTHIQLVKEFHPYWNDIVKSCRETVFNLNNTISKSGNSIDLTENGKNYITELSQVNDYSSRCV